MKPWMMAAISGSPQLVTRNFTSSQVVAIPFNVPRLETLTGKGQNGTPAVPGDYGYDTYSTTTTNGVTGPLTYISTTFNASAPNPYCTQSGGGSTFTETCYSYIEFDLSEPQTNGANTTGFGKTFAGGAGVAATPVTYNAVTVTPGGNYSITVPAGGYITITYFQ